MSLHKPPQIIAIDEAGLTLQNAPAFSPGQFVHLSCDGFRALRLDKYLLRVESFANTTIRLTWIGADTLLSAHLKQWRVKEEKSVELASKRFKGEVVACVNTSEKTGEYIRHILKQLGLSMKLFLEAPPALEYSKKVIGTNEAPLLWLVDDNNETAIIPFTFARALKKKNPQGNAWLLTSLNDKAYYQRALRAGLSDVLLHPVDRQILAIKLALLARTQEIEKCLTRVTIKPALLDSFQNISLTTVAQS